MHAYNPICTKDACAHTEVACSTTHNVALQVLEVGWLILLLLGFEDLACGMLLPAPELCRILLHAACVWPGIARCAALSGVRAPFLNQGQTNLRRPDAFSLAGQGLHPATLDAAGT
eukprot:1139938-Pelagomonas_calceolata.AAC.1